MFGTKKKLMTAVVMLIISAIMMTSASYAWFTISTNPEISGLTTQVVVNENLEIALASSKTAPSDSTLGDANNQYTWGNIIDFNYVTAYSSDGSTLRPATLTSGGTGSDAFRYPTYSSDGRVNALGSSGYMTVTSDGVLSDGFGYLKGENSKTYGYYVDFWLRSNVGGTVALSDKVYRDTGNSSGQYKGQGTIFTSKNEALAKNMSIAFFDITESNATISDKVVAYKATNSGTKSDGTTYTTSFTNDNIVTLSPNVPRLIRMYVYLEGEDVTNKAASITGTDGKITGKLNIQFKLDKDLTSMYEVN